MRCIAPLGSKAGSFVTGSRDTSVRAWRRGAASAPAMGVLRAQYLLHAGYVQVVRHVAHLEGVGDDLVLSGGVDGAIFAWPASEAFLAAQEALSAPVVKAFAALDGGHEKAVCALEVNQKGTLVASG